MPLTVFANESGAIDRAREVKSKLKALGLGNEYDHVVGGILVRVAGTVTPSPGGQLPDGTQGRATAGGVTARALWAASCGFETDGSGLRQCP